MNDGIASGLVRPNSMARHFKTLTSETPEKKYKITNKLQTVELWHAATLLCCLSANQQDPVRERLQKGTQQHAKGTPTTRPSHTARIPGKGSCHRALTVALGCCHLGTGQKE